MTHDLVEGTTEPQDFQLLDDGAPLVGTGFDVALVIAPAVGTSTPAVGSPAPVAEWLSQALGTVRVTGADILERGSYSVRYSLTDGSDDVGYAPNAAQSDTWRVVRV